MKRKLVNIALILVMLIMNFNILTSCDRSTDSSDDKFMEAINLDPAVLTFYLIGQEKKDTKEVLSKIAESTDLNITLNFKWFNYGRYFDSVKTAIASNEEFDLFLCGKPEVNGINIVELFRNGQVKDITGLLPKYAPVIFDELSREVLEAVKVDGKIVFLPSLAHFSSSVLGVNIKEDIVDKYNISSINTFDDYEILLKNINEKEKDVISGFIAGGPKYSINYFANAYGYVVLDYARYLVYKWDDPEMKIVQWEQTPEFKETIELIRRWYMLDYMEDVTDQKEIASFLGMAGRSEEGVAEIDFFNNGNKDIYHFYILYKNMRKQRENPLNSSSIGSIAFNANSVNTERSLMFLNWIQSSQENYDLFNYGIKDRHYILKDDQIDVPKGMKIDENPYWWHKLKNEFYNLAFMNINFSRSTVNDTPQDSFPNDQKEVFTANAQYAPHEGFYPDYKNVQNESSMRMQLYQDKILNAIQNNTYDTKDTDKIINALNQAGTERIVQEIQEQLDNWRSKNKK